MLSIKLKKICGKHNSGYALTSVLIVVTFISILATSILYLSGINFRIKYSDYQTKESFYQSEEVMEALRAQLICDVNDAVTETMTAMGYRYVTLGSEGTRQETYENIFKEKFQEKWEGHWKDSSGSWDYVSGIKSLIPGAKNIIVSSSFDTDGIVRFDYERGSQVYSVSINECSVTSPFSYYGEIDATGDLVSGSSPLVWHNVASDATQTVINGSASTSEIANSYIFERSYYTINDINVTVTGPNGYSSVIRTSFYVVPPTLNFDSIAASSDTRAVDFTRCVNYVNWSKE